jgi:hypothetical protein
MAETLYQYLTGDIKEAVDQFVDDIEDEDWHARFLYLFAILCEQLKKHDNWEAQAIVIQQWTAIITAVMERLPPDPAAIQCQALMSVSKNKAWRALALAEIDRDPSILDRIYAAYPSWFDVVESIVRAQTEHPLLGLRT